jgi:MraZ protein
MRQFYSRSQHVVADKQGRILLPEEYCKRFKLEGEIILVGVKETFELWNPEAWQGTQTAEEATYDRWAEQMGI